VTHYERHAQIRPASSPNAHPLPIDEVQCGGNALVVAIKADVDPHPRDPGRFFVTGSSRFLTVPSISVSLADRVRILDLWAPQQR
jgi:predicted AAA+ superfamily ATPase